MTDSSQPDPGNRNPGNTGSHKIIISIVLILALMTWLFGYIIDYTVNPNRNITGKSTARYNEVRLARNDYGHYIGSGTINGKDMLFMVDTGATGISIPSRLAKKYNLKRGKPVTMISAKGPGTSYLTHIKTLTIGTLKFTNIRGYITPNPDDNDILLGMDVLKTLEIIQRGNTMTLRQYK